MYSQQVGGPVDADLDAAGEVGRRRAALRAGQHDQVREAVDLACRGSVLGPSAHLSRSFCAADAPDVDAVEGAGDGVEAGGVDDDVEVVVARRSSGCPSA